jgi:hypothetical protein
LKIRPVYHRRQHRIEANICLNFTAYTVYKELERILAEKKSELSPTKVIEIIQNIYQITLLTPDNTEIKKTLIITEEQHLIQKLFGF